MKINCLFLSLLLMACTASVKTDKEEITLRQMQGSPAGEPGIELGVSACYAGTHQGKLLLAGGCNFPETPAAEGGKKRFYQSVYAADASADSVLVWHKVGDLPQPAAYGVALSTPEGIVCIGGSNGEGSLAEVFCLSLDGQGVLSVRSLPSLPSAVDNASGALLGSTLYLAGGNVNGVPSNALFALDMDHPENGWERLPDFPGAPRMQSVCVSQRGKDGKEMLFLWGGFAAAAEGRSATLSVDGYCYSPEAKAWTPLDAPLDAAAVPVSLGGGNAVACADSLILCTSGVDKDIFLAALQREERMKKALAAGEQELADSLRREAKEYMLMAPEAYRFNDRIMLYNTHTGSWKELTRAKETARAGAALVGDGSRFFHINGELKPGIRIPMIVKIELPACP